MKPASKFENTVRLMGGTLAGAWNFVVDVLKLYGEARARKTLEIYHPEIARATAPSCKTATPTQRRSAAKLPPPADGKLVTALAAAGA